MIGRTKSLLSTTQNTLFANQVVNLPTPLSLPTDHFCPNRRNTWKLQNLPCVVPTDATVELENYKIFIF